MSRLALRCLISGQGGFLLPVLASSALGAALKLPSFQWHCMLAFLSPSCGLLWCNILLPACGARLVCEISLGRGPVKRHKVSTGDRMAAA